MCELLALSSRQTTRLTFSLEALVAAFAGDLRQLGPANFLYADGEVLFAHGHRRIQSSTGLIEPPGLFMLSRQCGLAHESVLAQGVTVAPGFQEVVLIASVPLSAGHWRPLAEGEVVAVSAGRLLASRVGSTGPHRAPDPGS